MDFGWKFGGYMGGVIGRRARGGFVLFLLEGVNRAGAAKKLAAMARRVARVLLMGLQMRCGAWER